MEDLPETLELAVGESQSYVLPGLGMSGYVWQPRVGGEPGVVSVLMERGFAPGTEPAAVGVSAPETLTVHASAPGEVVLILEQARPWEHDTEPVAQRRVTVRVSNRG